MQLDETKYIYDGNKPEHVKRFFSTFLVHSKGKQAGKPFELLPWQDEIIDNIYGVVHKDNPEKRRYRSAILSCGRKQGKTTLIAGLCLYELIFGEDYGELVAAANSRDQAKVLFNAVADFVAQSKELQKRLEVMQHTVRNRKNKSVLRVISREANTAYGLNISFAVVDEMAFLPDSQLYDSLATAMGARKNPLIVGISTAGYNKRCFFASLLEFARDVRDGKLVDDTLFCRNYGLEDGDDWTSEEVWKKCNPSLGHTVDVDYLRSEFAKAVAFPAYEIAFKTLYLNGWVDSDKTWIPDEKWKKCGDSNLSLSMFEGQTCYAGLDLSSNTDLTSLSVVFPMENESYALFVFPFVPRDNMEVRVRRDKVPYETWAREGYLTATEGNVVDYEAIIQTLCTIAQNHRVHNVTIDRWNSSMLATKLQNEGFDVVTMGQGFGSMSEPTKFFERLVLSEKLKHNNNPVLAWCVSNAVIKIDPAGGCKLNKAKSRERIDCAVSSVMALESAAKDTLPSDSYGKLSFT